MITKREKLLVIIILSLLFTLSADLIFGRAGGGGGHGGGGGGSHGGHGGHGGSGEGWIFWIIGMALMGLYSVMVTVILLMKSSRGEKTAQLAAETDRIWDIKLMRSHSKDIFLRMQKAWMNRDIASVKSRITNDLYEDYGRQLQVMKENYEKNIIKDINITEINIISCEDYHDNSRDTFVAYIKGTILDYTINEKTGYVIKNENKEPEEFVDTYHFVRSNNRWLLNEIDNEVSLSDLLFAGNYKE